MSRLSSFLTLGWFDFEVNLPLLREKSFSLLMAAIIAVSGYLLSQALARLLDRLLHRTHLSEPMRELLVVLVRWGLLLLTLLFCAGVAATGVFGMSATWFQHVAFNILRTLAIFIIGFSAIGLIVKALRRILSTSHIDVALHPFLLSTARAVLLVLLGIGCVEMLGISTASLVAALASVGLALSLSAQDHLSNLIGGLVVLISKPFTVGNYVVFDNCEGTVEEISLIYTVLRTYDNKKVFVPNNDAAKSRITNVSAEEHRRLDIIFSIGYGDDYEQARKLILQAAEDSGLVLPEPAPMVRMNAYGEHAIQIVARLWVRVDDFFELGYRMHELVKRLFDEAGISIPYQQVALHIVDQERR